MSLIAKHYIKKRNKLPIKKRHTLFNTFKSINSGIWHIQSQPETNHVTLIPEVVTSFEPLKLVLFIMLLQLDKTIKEESDSYLY